MEFPCPFAPASTPVSDFNFVVKAPRASSTASFLASTPQTGIDSLLVTYALLGWIFALVRAIVAFISGILCGWSIRLIEKPLLNTTSTTQSIEKSDLRKQCLSALTYGFITLPRDIARPLLLGLFLSGVLTVFLPEAPFFKSSSSPPSIHVDHDYNRVTSLYLFIRICSPCVCIHSIRSAFRCRTCFSDYGARYQYRNAHYAP